jgi:cytochrome c-type biogenesis protein CcmH
LLLALALAQPSPNTPPPDFSPEVFKIAGQLRCPVCQGESAAESNAGIAVEMRRIIAEQLAQGKSDWILYEPPVRGLTLWVWLSPLLGLGLLGFGLWRYLTRVRARALTTASDVSEEEIARLEAELQSPERQP